MVGLRESREGEGKLGLQAALNAGVLEVSRGKDEDSGSSFSWLESLSDSLDPEPASSNKLRVLLTGEGSSADSLRGLQKQKRG